MKMPYEIGQIAYRAWAHPYDSVEVPCDVCFGKLFVTVILGNDEYVKVLCEACGAGYTGPSGRMITHEVRSGVEENTVTGISLDHNNQWSITTAYPHYCGDLFPTREEAEARRAVLHADAIRHEAEMLERNIKQKTKHKTWSVCYHRDCLKRLQDEARYHEKKLLLGPTILKEKK